jgi:hypothetical protein
MSAFSPYLALFDSICFNVALVARAVSMGIISDHGGTEGCDERGPAGNDFVPPSSKNHELR